VDEASYRIVLINKLYDNLLWAGSSAGYACFIFAAVLMDFMTEEQISILFLAFVAGGALWFRHWYRSQPRTYKVSEQISGGRMLTVFELNPRWETASIELKISSREPMGKIEAYVEFIPARGQAKRLSIGELGIDDVTEWYSDDSKQCSIRFEKRDLMRGIRQHEIKPDRFRFAAGDGETFLIKSHLFGFSSKYMLFRPDTGRYN
jgi:hypothetical protein